MKKFFLRSRALWGAAIPLMVALAGFSDINTTNLDQELDELGASVSLVAAAVLTLRSRFKPDNATLTATPDVGSSS